MIQKEMWHSNAPAENMERSHNKIFKRSYFIVKRLFDIILSLIGLILAFPVFGVVAILNRFGSSKGALFYKQQRLGRDGQLFGVYKLRTMVEQADEALKANGALYEKYVANHYKLDPDEDPRITKFGSFLRKTSIDELPQLVNVLKGEMSLVGPRPIVAEELQHYAQLQQDFLSVKPGVTGYWQVNGRSDVGYPERVDLELYYVYHQSLFLDFKIMLKTLYVVLMKKGAY